MKTFKKKKTISRGAYVPPRHALDLPLIDHLIINKISLLNTYIFFNLKKNLMTK